MSIYISKYNFLDLPPVCSVPALHRDLILLDIIAAKPVGPMDETEVYRDTSNYKAAYMHDYDPVVFFRLGVRDKDSLKEQIRRLKFNNESDETLKAKNRTGALTRFTNRGWAILRASLLSVKSVGSQGVYEAFDYTFGSVSGGVLAYVYADSMDTAAIIAKSLFGFMASSENIKVRYIEWESKEYAAMLNVRLVSALSESYQKLVERRKEIGQKIEEVSSQIESITNIMQENPKIDS